MSSMPARTALVLLGCLAAPPSVVPAAQPSAPAGNPGNWIDHFDTYGVGSQLHGQGGWQGWNGDPNAGAMTSGVQARSAPASVDIVGASILVHTHSGISTGVWTFTAWQYIASPNGDQQKLLLLNTYPISLLSDWSAIVCFDGLAGLVRDDPTGLCNGTTTLPLALDRWVEIRVVIDLDQATQAFYYDGELLYQDSWVGHVECCGAPAFAAVELFANGAGSSAFYDDLSLSGLPFTDGFEGGDTRAWHAAAR